MCPSFSLHPFLSFSLPFLPCLIVSHCPCFLSSLPTSLFPSFLSLSLSPPLLGIHPTPCSPPLFLSVHRSTPSLPYDTLPNTTPSHLFPHYSFHLTSPHPTTVSPLLSLSSLFLSPPLSLSLSPSGTKENEFSAPWLRMFQNARTFCENVPGVGAACLSEKRGRELEAI
jgi:hypothetical protein